ncbi:MAG TPA: S8 family peptidase [Fimbriimonadaceae bacterium]|nr:S8 family peptidase [Fimbriimonadaceae bacterium]
MRLKFLMIASVMTCAAIGWGQNYEPGELLVKFRQGAPVASMAALAGASVASENHAIGTVRLDLPGGMSVTQAAAFYRSMPNVVYAEPNYKVRAFGVPNDPGWSQQYGPLKMQCPAAWDLETGDPGVIIAIIDTGIDLSHPDLSGKLVPGYDFVNQDANPQDDQGHGTHCAGIAAASTHNGVGVAGVGYHCRLMPVKVLDASGSGNFSDVTDGITWAVQNGAKVISLSLGAGSGSQALADAVDYAWNNGAVVVAAAGNNGWTSPAYPAYYMNAIAVASTDQSDQRSGFSNYGEWVDVAAPGSSIYSTYMGGGYGYMSGTSMACPGVAGLAGLVFSRLGANATPAQVRAAIESSCDDVGSFVAHGRVNALAAMNSGGGGGGGGPVVLSGVQLAKTTASAGETVSGTVNLSGQAPNGGVVVNLSSTITAVATVNPAQVTVQEGATSATFNVVCANVGSQRSVTINASSGGVTKSTALLVKPSLTLASVSLSRSTVRGGGFVTLRVTLNSPAPAGGVRVALASSNPSLTRMATSVFVARGLRSAGVSVVTRPVSTQTQVTLTATSAGSSKSVPLTITR